MFLRSRETAGKEISAAACTGIKLSCGDEMKSDRFGIDIRKYCKDHEEAVRAVLAEGRVTQELYVIHREKIRILQHERLVHLIVTVMVVFVEAFVTELVLVHPEMGIVPAVVMLGLAVLLAFYFRHYFFLENTVQRWYILLDELRYGSPNSRGVCASERKTPGS